MNKVVNIELAGQIFWIEEQAYKDLEDYLDKIMQQLYGREYAADILGDIEHRLAELLFELAGNNKETITGDHLAPVVAQIGYLDSEDLETDTTRKSYLDLRNKVVSGVCAGLAKRLDVSTSMVRLLFIGSTFVFGLGALAYIILWLSLDTDRNRNSYLTAQGRAPTAKLIAMVDDGVDVPHASHSRLFFPFRILGKCLSLIHAEYLRHKSAYAWLFKCTCALLLVSVNVTVAWYLSSFIDRRLFTPSVSWLIIISVAVIMTAATAAIVQRCFFHHAKLKHLKLIITGILIPIIVITSGVIYLEEANTFEHREIVEKFYSIDDEVVIIKFDENMPDTVFSADVGLFVRVKQNQADRLTVRVQYFSRGKSIDDAINNIHQISYVYTVSNNVLRLNRKLSLQKNSLYRGQNVVVTLEIPRGTKLISPQFLEIKRDVEGYYYAAYGKAQESTKYFARPRYLHELNLGSSRDVSKNEFFVLKESFCEKFFVGEIWQCDKNVDLPAGDNRLLNPLFQNHIEPIEKLRSLLKTSRPFDFQALLAVQKTLASFNSTNQQDDALIQYVDDLVVFKKNQAM